MKNHGKLTAVPALVVFMATFVSSSITSDPWTPKVKNARYISTIKSKVLTRNFILFSSEYLLLARLDPYFLQIIWWLIPKLSWNKDLQVDNAQVSKSWREYHLSKPEFTHPFLLIMQFENYKSQQKCCQNWILFYKFPFLLSCLSNLITPF